MLSNSYARSAFAFARCILGIVFVVFFSFLIFLFFLYLLSILFLFVRFSLTVVLVFLLAFAVRKFWATELWNAQVSKVTDWLGSSDPKFNETS